MIGRVLTQDCSSPARTRETFAKYLSCMKQTLDENYGLYENEFREHSRRAALTCFAPTIEEGNRKDRCVLSANDLNQVAWDRHGPLRDCTLCRTFASGALKAFKSTPPEEQKCIRTEMSKAIVREADYCVKKQIPGFVGLPELPDIEEKSYTYRDSVITSLSNHIIILSRLSFCKERKPTRAANTNSCLRKPFPDYLSEHCKVFTKCDSLIAVGSCARTIPQSRKAMCQCINGARDELKSKIASIYNVLNDKTNSLQYLSQVTRANDWASVIDSAINTCVRKQQGQNLGLDAMLNVGCRKVFADTTGTATSQMKIAFDFINNLIDALVERSGRFCGDQCVKS
ncbi:unnamed protein product [Angiostrongylus costaricensis]|uniref:DUF725 domain-containing protein n=1 Tax=Angiostrongylus costaricensis TaxID=334426 RepID=A0A158PIX9_ANGCS|nr:unnamed protein product [Angiostrongylus costaricensis]